MFQRNKEDKDGKCSGVRIWYNWFWSCRSIADQYRSHCTESRRGNSRKVYFGFKRFPGDPNADKIVHDYDIIDKDEDVQVVVECMGGVEPAYTFVKRALLNGRSVATSNKELVAKHGAELIAIAHEKNINFLFEASVGGGIPIIRPLVQCLTADVIEEVSGILNGTTNYMLTRMKEEGISLRKH